MRPMLWEVCTRLISPRGRQSPLTPQPAPFMRVTPQAQFMLPTLTLASHTPLTLRRVQSMRRIHLLARSTVLIHHPAPSGKLPEPTQKGEALCHRDQKSDERQAQSQSCLLYTSPSPR